MTNLDWFHSATTEELMSFLLENRDPCTMCIYWGGFSRGCSKPKKSDSFCSQGVSMWLKADSKLVKQTVKNIWMQIAEAKTIKEFCEIINSAVNNNAETTGRAQINAMSNNELASLLMPHDCKNCIAHDYCIADGPGAKECHDTIKDWLEMECDENDIAKYQRNSSKRP